MTRSPYVNSSNVAALMDAIRSHQSSGDFYPAVFVLEPISRCNLKCVMCPNSLMPSTDIGEMTLQHYETLLTKIAPYCEFLMLYWMGETTLHSQFTELLRLAREIVDGKIVLSTNMTNFSSEIEAAITSNTDIVLCCIDRWEKKKFERIRVGANFEDVVNNTLSLITASNGSNCEIIVKALDLDSKDNEYQEFSEFWTKQGATPMLAWLNDWAGTRPGIRNAASLAIPHSASNRVPCADLWFKMVINWKGDVQICCFDWMYQDKLGTLLEQSIEEIWHSEEIASIRAAHANGEFSSKKICAVCNSWGEIEELKAYLEPSNTNFFRIF